MTTTANTTFNGRRYRSISATFTRPNDANAYTAGDLVANNTAAASAAAMSFVAAGQAPFTVPAFRLQKSGTSVTNAQFRLHLYGFGTPTFTGTGDNGVYGTVVATGVANWLGSFDGTFVNKQADGCACLMVPTEGVIMPRLVGDAGQTVYALLEALAAYTPGAQEVFTAAMVMEFDQ